MRETIRNEAIAPLLQQVDPNRIVDFNLEDCAIANDEPAGEMQVRSEDARGVRGTGVRGVASGLAVGWRCSETEMEHRTGLGGLPAGFDLGQWTDRRSSAKIFAWLIVR
ncbi:MAG: hypothetical protein NXI31_11255 [bacterium]|nr:hypothetical protein [bacterium]